MSFAYDSLSLLLSQEAITVGEDCKLESLQQHADKVLQQAHELLKKNAQGKDYLLDLLTEQLFLLYPQAIQKKA